MSELSTMNMEELLIEQSYKDDDGSEYMTLESFNELARRLQASEQLNATLTARCAVMEKALKELYALVKGECPSLLNEDSGGDGFLDLAVTEALSQSPAARQRVRKIVEAAEMWVANLEHEFDAVRQSKVNYALIKAVREGDQS